MLLQKHKTLWTEYQANLSPESSGQRQVIQQPLPLLFLMWCPRDRTRSPTVSRCRHEEVDVKWMVRHRQDSDTWERISGQRSKAHRWERKGAESRSLRSSPPSRGRAGQGAGEADGGRAARLCPGSPVLRQTSSRSVSLY